MHISSDNWSQTFYKGNKLVHYLIYGDGEIEKTVYGDMRYPEGGMHQGRLYKKEKHSKYASGKLSKELSIGDDIVKELEFIVITKDGGMQIGTFNVDSDFESKLVKYVDSFKLTDELRKEIESENKALKYFKKLFGK
ncbi:MAG: hypothetical protein HZB68_04030 [Candidatus Aenigmarchaeota archaeon]|nr:hypothetical protein [Candidatus Aenigmarchaeota archaeon]